MQRGTLCTTTEGKTVFICIFHHIIKVFIPEYNLKYKHIIKKVVVHDIK